MENYYTISPYFSNSPLDQFEIRDLISIDAAMFDNIHISITNIALYLTITSLIMFTLHLTIQKNNTLTFNN
jgi:F-type H+-transporting ATPase subunit a